MPILRHRVLSMRRSNGILNTHAWSCKPRYVGHALELSLTSNSTRKRRGREAKILVSGWIGLMSPGSELILKYDTIAYLFIRF
jgi:hypothetical protein